MKRNRRTMTRPGHLLVLSSLAAACALAQPADTQPSTRPAARLPEAYHLQPNLLLTYQINVTSRLPQAGGTGLLEQVSWRDVAVVDVEEDALMMYVGTAKPAPAPEVPHVASPPGQRRASPPPTAPPQPAKSEPAEIIWTRYELGRSFARNANGSITYRPTPAASLPFALPSLPPPGVREDESFDLTVPDLLSASGKTLALRGHWRTLEAGQVIVTATPSPGAVRTEESPVEVARYEYRLDPSPAGVQSLTVTQRMPPEQAKYSVQGRLRVQPAEVGPGGQARPIGPAYRQREELQTTVAVFRLVETRPLTDEQHEALIALIRRGGTQGEQGDSMPAAPEPVDAPPPAAAQPPQPPPEERPRFGPRGMAEQLKEQAESRDPVRAAQQ